MASAHLLSFLRTRWLAEKRNATGTITCRTIRLSIQRNVYPKTWSRVSLLCRLNRSWLQGGLCAMQVRNHKRAVVCRPLPLCLTLIRVMTVRRNNYLRHPRNRDIGSAVYTHFVGWREGEKKKRLWINTKTAVNPFVKLLIQLLYWRLSF